MHAREFYKHILPNIGVLQDSALATILGAPISINGNASRKVECGAATKILASDRLAFTPFTFCLVKPAP